MISHLIIKHKPRINVVNTDWYNNPNSGGYNHQKPKHIAEVVSSIGQQMYHLGKMQYLEMLKSLRMKKGNYCVFRNAPYPYNAETAIWKVIDITECHWLDKGNILPLKEPKPYILKNKNGEEAYANDNMVFQYVATPDRAW